MKSGYEVEVKKLSRVIDIALESIEKIPPTGWEKQHVDQFKTSYRMFKERILNAEPQFRNSKNLKYDVENVFTYFQEAVGDTVEYFWKRLKEESLDYRRKNKLEDILRRNKIKSRIEFDYVTDVMSPMQQAGNISETEFKQLSKLLGEYEAKRLGGNA